MSIIDRPNGSGGTPPGPPGSDPFTAMTMALASMIKVFAPHLTEEQAVQLAQIMEREGEHIAPVVRDGVDPSMAEKYPLWGMKISGPDGGSGQIVAPKRATPNMKPHDFLTYVTMLCLVTSPLPRAILKAFGYKYEFIQGKMKGGGGPLRLVQ